MKPNYKAKPSKKQRRCPSLASAQVVMRTSQLRQDLTYLENAILRTGNPKALQHVDSILNMKGELTEIAVDITNGVAPQMPVGA